ncbi:GPI mannosyltransferase 3-like [Daphnia carinata]|uniref:GPI mannosyltransferase 3-like n=1 Tax=Daphnia carinata TaxID=120202 RepID=UPI0025799CF8|nr:GPI mannosyltransferase 3-like [Daphnia carinata]
MRNQKFLFLFLLTRLSSVIVVQTWFVPDEYWQSLEVSHKLSFGYGYLTWEWFEGIRSIIYPAVFFIPYKILAYLCLDSRQALIYVPRVIQALFSAWAEWDFMKATKNIINGSQVSWFILLQLGNYFLYYVTSRTLANTVEMNLILLGISYFLNQCKGSFLLCVMISCYMRPTSAPVWLPFLLCFCQQEKHWILSKNFLKVMLKCSVVLGAVLGLDSWWYGKLVLVPVQFLLFNLVNDFSEFYGQHPWHWYFTNAIPSLMGPTLIPLMFIFSNKKTLNSIESKVITVQLSALLYILCHSFVGHKEIRFLTPIIPLLNFLAAIKLPNLRCRKSFLILFCTWNISLIWYLSVRHQRGVLDATNFIGSFVKPEDEVLYLMPCHSTPLYSHVHVNASLQFLTCPPNLHNLKNYSDEADRFYENPPKWLVEKPSWALAKYVVIFDTLFNTISSHLDSNDYHLIGNFFHADMDQGRVGRRVFIFQKEKKSVQ